VSGGDSLLCRECPFIYSEFERKSEGISDEEALLACELSCHCEKIGGKLRNCGVCADAVAPSAVVKDSGCKRSTKQTRTLAYRNHLLFLANHVHRYPLPAYYKDSVFAGWKQGGWIPAPNPRYVRLYRGNHSGNAYKYYKKVANHSVRRYRKAILNGNGYRKLYDYWWAVD